MNLLIVILSYIYRECYCPNKKHFYCKTYKFSKSLSEFELNTDHLDLRSSHTGLEGQKFRHYQKF